MPAEGLDISQRVEISLVLQRYLRAVERFESANTEFSQACQDVRGKLPKNCRYIANVNHQHHLVTCDDAGNFQIEQIDTI